MTIATTSRERLRQALRTLAFVTPFAALYMGFSATLGLLGGGAPLVLRARGMSLGEVGLLQLMYLPIGVTFLWAPLVDRIRLPRLPHRIGWITAGQAMTIALLLALSRAIDWPIPVIFSLAVLVSVTLATMDISLEALVVETIETERRPLITTAKLCGSSIGTMIGIGLPTIAPATLDLSASLVLVAVLDAALLIPVLRYPEVRRRLATGIATRAQPTRERFQFLAGRGAVLGFFFAAAIMIVSVPSLTLLDLKLSLRAVGLFTGALTTGLTLTMTIVSGALMMRMAAHRVTALLASGVVASGVLFALATWLQSMSLGYAAALINVLFEGGLGVPVFNIIYRWAEGDHAATDYAVLFGIAFLVSFPVRVLSPMLAGAIGWPTYFVLCTPVYAVSVLLLTRAMAKTPPRSPQPEAT